jgi:plasmid stabilization system protein ParE
MKRFILHPAAERDLDEIWEYIATDNIAAADRLVEEIFFTIRRLTAHPGAGHRRSDLTRKPVRFAVVREYLIAYAPDEEPLLVLAIVHGRRSPLIISGTLRERTDS